MAKPKRFYKRAGALAREGGYTVALDDRPVKTPKQRDLLLPAEPLAAAIAAEWEAQAADAETAPETMPLMRLACTALDHVADERAAIVEQLAAYAGSDLLCYRAEHPQELAERQAEAWDPLLEWLAETYGVRLAVTAGLMPAAQPAEAHARLAPVIEAQPPLELTALQGLVTGTGSLVLGLAVLDRRIDAETAFAASRIDEDWQIEQWGEDAEAAARRAQLRADLLAAERMLRLLTV
jgi:chaperone required for assembly of F1-ATPase